MSDSESSSTASDKTCVRVKIRASESRISLTPESERDSENRNSNNFSPTAWLSPDFSPIKKRDSVCEEAEFVHKSEVVKVISDLDSEIEELECTVVYWQTLFDESQKEAVSLRSKIRDLDCQLQAAYTDDRPAYLEDVGIDTSYSSDVHQETPKTAAPQVAGNAWGFLSSVKNLVGRKFISAETPK